MKNKVRWIVFDAMGVIFKVGDDTGRLLIPMLRELVPALTKEQIYAAYIEASLGNLSAFDFWQRLGLGEDYPQIQNAYLDQYLTLDELFKPVAKEMAERYRLAMLSNDLGEWSNHLRKRHGLDELFDEVIISADVGLRKPSEQIYKLLLQRIGALPENCIFVDDSIENLKAAAKLGINTVLYNRDKITDYDGHLINSFADLKHVVHKIYV